MLENEQFLTNLTLGPGSGSDPLFSKRIRIREKITDPTDPGSGSETLLHCLKYRLMPERFFIWIQLMAFQGYSIVEYEVIIDSDRKYRAWYKS